MFAHNHKRDPWLANDGSALFVNNVIYNPRRQIMSIAGGGREPSNFTAVGNVVLAGPSTQPWALSHLMFVQRSARPGTQVHLADNQLAGQGSDWDVSTDHYRGASRAEVPLMDLPEPLLPSSRVVAAVLAGVGARPFDRARSL